MHEQRHDAGGDAETGSERGSNQVADACEGEAGHGDGIGAHGEQHECAEHRQHVEELEHVGVAPRQAGGREHRDREPDAALERECAPVLPRERDGDGGKRGHPDQEAQPPWSISEQRVGEDAEQRRAEQRTSREAGAWRWNGERGPVRLGGGDSRCGFGAGAGQEVGRCLAHGPFDVVNVEYFTVQSNAAQEGRLPCRGVRPGS